MNEQTDFTKKDRKEVFVINERNGQSYFTKVGVAFDNRDGSTTLMLDAVPVGSGKLQVRPIPPDREQWQRSRPPTLSQTVERYAVVGATQ